MMRTEIAAALSPEQAQWVEARELDGTIKERFDREFKIIEQKFQEYFKILFNGGSAKIIRSNRFKFQSRKSRFCVRIR